jgi:TPP-dependent 2-oxoacid decarboxylase
MVGNTRGSGNGATAPQAVVGEVLLDRLVRRGVRHVFGVPGDYNLGLLDIVEGRDDVEWVGTANELGAAYAADGYARINGFAVVLTTYGVGELSAINGIAGSYAESVPVLQITGAPTSEVQAKGSPMHHSLLDGDFNHFHRAYDEVTCASAALTAKNAISEVDRVIATMLEEKRPGYLFLPADVVSAPAFTAVSERAVSGVGDIVITPPKPPQELGTLDGVKFLEQVTLMLQESRSVVVLVDHLADRYQAGGQVNSLIETANLPSAVVASGKGIIDETLPGFLGLYIGALSDPVVRDVVETADVLIAVGLCLVDLTSGGFTTKLDPDRLIDVQPHHVVVRGRTFESVTMSAALVGLTSAISERRAPEVATSLPATASGAEVAPEDALSQEVFWNRLGGFFREGDLIAADQGTSYYGMLGVRLPPGVDLVAQPMWSSIGYTLPALMGAQLASPHRRAVLVIGDGAAQLTVQELGTIVRHRLAPIIFIVNNGGYTVERAINGWEAVYNDIALWQWAKIPGAFGARDAVIRRASTVAELDEALLACESADDQIAFVEVVLDRHDLPTLLARLAEAVAGQNN